MFHAEATLKKFYFGRNSDYCSSSEPLRFPIFLLFKGLPPNVACFNIKQI